MKRNNYKKLICALAISVFIPAVSYSATQSVTANIAFDTALTLTKNNNISFGTVKAATSGTYTVSTASAISAGSGGVVLYGTPAAGSITIAGSTTQTINVAAQNLGTDSGVQITATTCNYNSGGSGSCTIASGAAPGAGKTLLVGATVSVDGSQSAGSTAAPTLDIVVNYN